MSDHIPEPQTPPAKPDKTKRESKGRVEAGITLTLGIGLSLIIISYFLRGCEANPGNSGFSPYLFESTEVRLNLEANEEYSKAHRLKNETDKAEQGLRLAQGVLLNQIVQKSANYSTYVNPEVQRRFEDTFSKQGDAVQIARDYRTKVNQLLREADQLQGQLRTPEKQLDSRFTPLQQINWQTLRRLVELKAIPPNHAQILSQIRSENNFGAGEISDTDKTSPTGVEEYLATLNGLNYRTGPLNIERHIETVKHWEWHLLPPGIIALALAVVLWKSRNDKPKK